MASFTVTIDSICAGGNHIRLTVTSGAKTFPLELTKQDFALELEDIERDVAILLRSFVKESGLTNWAQIKTAIEAKTFKV